jgi:hypothetical protein
MLAITAEYLLLMDPSLPINTSILNNICPHLSETVEEEEEGLFSYADLVKRVNQAINSFKKAELYEFCIELYKFIIPFLERNRENLELSNAYSECSKLYTVIHNADESRMLGTYFRIGFYGHRFEELNGKEFIYKEPKSTHLFELSERLKTMYGKRFGPETVVVFPDSGRVDVGKLENSKCMAVGVGF